MGVILLSGWRIKGRRLWKVESGLQSPLPRKVSSFSSENRYSSNVSCIMLSVAGSEAHKLSKIARDCMSSPGGARLAGIINCITNFRIKKSISSSAIICE